MRINNTASQVSSLSHLNMARSKVLEQLSSGQRINRAADDAAGLSISEGMRSQIRGLRQATRNTNDGISFMNVKEAGLEEVHRMLERMRELNIQALNDSYTDEDRKYMTDELEELKSEIENIARNTEFNTKKAYVSDPEKFVSISTKNSLDREFKLDQDLEWTISLSDNETREEARIQPRMFALAMPSGDNSNSRDITIKVKAGFYTRSEFLNLIDEQLSAYNKEYDESFYARIDDDNRLTMVFQGYSSLEWDSDLAKPEKPVEPEQPTEPEEPNKPGCGSWALDWDREINYKIKESLKLDIGWEGSKLNDLRKILLAGLDKSSEEYDLVDKYFDKLISKHSLEIFKYESVKSYNYDRSFKLNSDGSLKFKFKDGYTEIELKKGMGKESIIEAINDKLDMRVKAELIDGAIVVRPRSLEDGFEIEDNEIFQDIFSRMDLIEPDITQGSSFYKQGIGLREFPASIESLISFMPDEIIKNKDLDFSFKLNGEKHSLEFTKREYRIGSLVIEINSQLKDVKAFNKEGKIVLESLGKGKNVSLSDFQGEGYEKLFCQCQLEKPDSRSKLKFDMESIINLSRTYESSIKIKDANSEKYLELTYLSEEEFNLKDDISFKYKDKPNGNNGHNGSINGNKDKNKPNGNNGHNGSINGNKDKDKPNWNNGHNGSINGNKNNNQGNNGNNGHINGNKNNGSYGQVASFRSILPMAYNLEEDEDNQYIAELDNIVARDDKNTRDVFHIGANSSESFEVNNTELSTFYLGINAISFDNRDLAENALSKIDGAVRKVSSDRSYIASISNRMESIVRNNENYEENLTAAESRIRDTDMAASIMESVRLELLNESGFRAHLHKIQDMERVLSLVS